MEQREPYPWGTRLKSVGDIGCSLLMLTVVLGVGSALAVEEARKVPDKMVEAFTQKADTCIQEKQLGKQAARNASRPSATPNWDVRGRGISNPYVQQGRGWPIGMGYSPPQTTKVMAVCQFHTRQRENNETTYRMSDGLCSGTIRLR